MTNESPTAFSREAIIIIKIMPNIAFPLGEIFKVYCIPYVKSGEMFETFDTKRNVPQLLKLAALINECFNSTQKFKVHKDAL